ncbi:MAG TPA: hypothetical protein PLQ90_04105 [Sphaerochaeta sp.]|nr:hypothetical protein [Sphaerochaeta sp.]
MKKNIVAVLLVIALSTAAAFAATSVGTSSFDVSTNVTGRHGLILVATGTSVPNTRAEFLQLTADNSDFGINDNNYTGTHTVRRLIAMSNNRNGFFITMSASPMNIENTNYYINYTVTAGNATIDTSTSIDGGAVEATQNVFATTSPIQGLTFAHADVTVAVNQNDYLKAVAGEYSGTITFNLMAN